MAGSSGKIGKQKSLNRIAEIAEGAH